VYGPYEDRIVLEHGLHQGAWFDGWFIHFQDRGAYGRVVHLQPLKWVNDWPVIDVVPATATSSTLQASDEFDSPRLGLQWQWQGERTYSLHDGKLRPGRTPLLQKFPAQAFTVTTRIVGGNGGLIITGADEKRLAANARYLRVTVTPNAACRFSTSSDGKTFTATGGPFIARDANWMGAKVGIFGD